MMIEHIFFDLDGTLIGSAGDVKDSVWGAIDGLRGRIGMSVCTGRPRAGIAQRVAERLEPGGLHIFENGAMIAPPGGDPFAVSALEVVDALDIAEAAQSIDATVEFYTPDGVFVSRLDADCIEHSKAIELDVEEADLTEIAQSRPVLRAHWIMRDPVVEQVMAVRLAHSQIGLASSPVLPGMIFGSVTRHGTTKGTAASQVAEALSFDLDDAAGIGDAMGDLPLLVAVGHPYVVANSPTELLDRFTVLGHVDKIGVEAFLREMARG